MTVLSAQTIRKLGIIKPFHERTIYNGMSYGLSHCGYDIRLKQKWNFHPYEYAVLSSVEHFDMPDHIMGRVCDKSSWARQGITVQNTIIEPGWRGYLTLEICNNKDSHIFIEAGMPIAQIVFEFLDHAVAGYNGKYQDQPDHPVAWISEKAKDG